MSDGSLLQIQEGCRTIEGENSMEMKRDSDVEGLSLLVRMRITSGMFRAGVTREVAGG